MKHLKPEFSSLDAVRAFYQELSVPRRPYYKTMVRVFTKSKRGGSFVDRVIHTDPNHVKLSKIGYKDARRVEVLKIKDSNGNSIPYVHVEYTDSLLYSPVGHKFGKGAINYEWALLLKIDGDIARRKTGNVDDGLIHYVNDLKEFKSRKVKIAVNKLKKEGRENRHLPKSNAQDIIERYGRDDPEVLEWALRNASKLEKGNFYHENYEFDSMEEIHSLSDQDINTLLK